MTVDRERDVDALRRTGESPVLDEPAFEDIDPEKTLVREDWETTVIRRIAPHVAAVQSSIGEDTGTDRRFGWESEGLRRLAQELSRAAKE